MVELKKELPEIFEEFAEQRKNSFLAIKEVKEKEIPVEGLFYGNAICIPGTGRHCIGEYRYSGIER